MSSACVCHTDEWCFYCNMYLPLQDENQKLQVDLQMLKLRHDSMLDLLKEVSELLSWRDDGKGQSTAYALIMRWALDNPNPFYKPDTEAVTVE